MKRNRKLNSGIPAKVMINRAQGNVTLNGKANFEGIGRQSSDQMPSNITMLKMPQATGYSGSRNGNPLAINN
jgi:hypothetical protein